jgi:hypothetical protein
MYAGTAHAGSIDYSGTLANGTIYDRPSYTNPNTPAINCDDCGYQAQALTVSQTGSYTFKSTASSFADQVGVLYANSFDPADAFENFQGPVSYALYATGNQATVSLTAGVLYFWVTSTDFGYTNDARANCDAAPCTFTTNISGVGDIALGVPEPSTLLMLAGFGAFGAALRSRRQRAVSHA